MYKQLWETNSYRVAARRKENPLYREARKVLVVFRTMSQGARRRRRERRWTGRLRLVWAGEAIVWFEDFENCQDGALLYNFASSGETMFRAPVPSNVMP